MSVRISTQEKVVALFDSATDTAFGKVFQSEEEAEDFLKYWYRHNSSDPRQTNNLAHGLKEHCFDVEAWTPDRFKSFLEQLEWEYRNDYSTWLEERQIQEDRERIERQEAYTKALHAEREREFKRAKKILQKGIG